MRFGLRYAAVNGVQTDVSFSVEVSAGETSNAAIILKDDTLDHYGITEFTDIELSFLATDADDLSNELDDDSPSTSTLWERWKAMSGTGTLTASFLKVLW